MRSMKIFCEWYTAKYNLFCETGVAESGMCQRSQKELSLHALLSEHFKETPQLMRKRIADRTLNGAESKNAGARYASATNLTKEKLSFSF